MNRRVRAACVAMSVALGVLAVPNMSEPADATESWERPPTNEEIGLMVYANMARAAQSPPRLPLMWNDDLAAAARAHSGDMAEHGCYQHNSCNGQSWVKRVESFYGKHWTGLGENIGAGSTDPENLHAGWMGSTGHRANILGGGFTEFGAGIELGEDNFGTLPLGTEDFGSRGLTALQLYPKIPAGMVNPRQSSSTVSRTLMVNAYKYQDGIDSVRAIVNGQPVAMNLLTGNAENGTYSVIRSFTGTGCVPVYFETRSGTETWRWPETDAILVGVNRTNCAERGPGGGTPPTSTPTTQATTTTIGATTTTTNAGAGAPTVVITSPEPGATVAGSVVIRASATDNGTVKSIEVYVDGRLLVRRQSSSVARQWIAGAAKVSTGDHTITVKAYDDQGNVGTRSITVTK